MTATGHAIIGTVIAAKIGNPYLAIPLAVASHVAADLVPHWDFGFTRKGKTRNQLIFEAGLDVLLGFLVAFLLINFFFPGTNYFYAFWVIIAAQLLDWLSFPYWVFNYKKPPFSWVHNFQSATNTKLDKPWGIFTQIAVATALVVLGVVF